MKKLKFEIKDWLFGGLLKILFKVSTHYKLIKFERVENNDIINYNLSIKIKRPNCESLIVIEKQTSQYLDGVVDKNLREEKRGWVNGGFDPNSTVNKAKNFPVKGGTVKNRNHECF